MRFPHQTVPIWVRVDVDKRIAGFVESLQKIPGIRTHASCEGTLHERGPNPYRAQVMVTWKNEKALNALRDKFDITFPAGSKGWAYVHPPTEPKP
jgi:hypothetical protein